jgi:heme oxygenase
MRLAGGAAAVENASRALAKLNLETRAHHAAADEGWLGLLSPATDRWEYLRQLVIAYGFEAPLECAFAYTPRLHFEIELRDRSRAGLLAQDLLQLGLNAGEIATLPQYVPLAPFGTVVEALGWMYVNERATLLRDSTRRHVVARVPDASRACAYISAYDGVASARWLAFGAVLDRVATTDPMIDELISAARAGFRSAIAWSNGTHASCTRAPRVTA